MKKFILYLVMFLLCFSAFADKLSNKILIGKTWHGEYTLHNDMEVTNVKIIADMIFITENKVILKEEYKIYDNSWNEIGGGANNEVYGYKILETDKSILVVCVDYTDNCTTFKYKKGLLVNEDFDNIIYKLKEEK